MEKMRKKGKLTKSKVERMNEYYERGQLALQSKQYDYAISMFRSALNIDPDFTGAQDGLRRVWVEEALSGPIHKQKFRAILYMLQATLWEKLKKWEKALQKYEQLFALCPPVPQMLPHLADVYWGHGMTQKAIAVYDKVLEIDSRNLYVLRQLGSLLLEQKMLTEARPIYERLAEVAGSDGALSKEIKDAMALMTIDRGGWEEESSFRKKTADRAAEEEEKGETAEAKEKPATKEVGDAAAAADLAPDDPEAQARLARAYQAQGLPEKAARQWEKACDLAPHKTDYRRELIDIYKEHEEYGRAAQHLERIIRAQPKNIDCQDELADIYVKQDNEIKAMEVLKRILDLEPNRKTTCEQLADIYLRARYFDQAIDAYEKLATLDPSRAEIHERLGNLYLRRGRSDAAIEKFERVVKLDPKRVPIFLQLGDLYQHKRVYPEAKEHFSRALELEPGNAPATTHLREIEVVMLDEEAQRFQKIASDNPEDQEAKKQFVELSAKRDSLAIADLEEKLRQFPDNYGAHYRLGVLCYQQDDVDQALPHFQAAIVDEEQMVDCRYMIALCFEKKGMLDLAVAQLVQASQTINKMDDQKKQITYALGSIYGKMGKSAEAAAEFKHIFEVDTGYRDVAQKVEEAYRT